MTSSPDAGLARRRRPAARRCRRCGGCASSATATSRGCMLAAFVLSLLAALPDALLALWLKLLGEGVLEQRRAAWCCVAAIGARRVGRRPPGSCARSAPACSAASATG